MSYRITGLDPDLFQKYFSMSPEALAPLGISFVTADDIKPGYPCRVSLEDAAPGERLILINHEHLSTPSPYRSAHAIFVAENSVKNTSITNQIPAPIRDRIISVRAFDISDMIVDADIIDGGQVEDLIVRFLDNPEVAFLHLHFAKRGCYAARVDRVYP